MTFPVELHFGSVHLSLHFVFELLAFGLGYRYYRHLRGKKPDPISSGNRLWILIGAAAGAFLFSRLLGGLEEPFLFFSGTLTPADYYANRTIVGGLLGGLVGVELTKKLIGEKESSGDLFTYPLILAVMVGRVGCFLSGVAEPTYGVPTGLPWGMDLGDGIPRHPVALYEILFLALLWISLRAVEKRYDLRSGLRFALFMIAYLLFRFGIDFIKPGFRFSFGLTSIQIACLLGLLYYAVLTAARSIIPSFTLFRRNHA